MRLFALCCMMLLCYAGCQSAPPQKSLIGEPIPKKEGLEAVNDSLGIVNDFYVVGVEGLEYVGDKTEDLCEYLGDIYESL